MNNKCKYCVNADNQCICLLPYFEDETIVKTVTAEDCKNCERNEVRECSTYL